VGSTFLETMEIPIVAGRAIDKRDVEGAAVAAVVNQVFAEKYFTVRIRWGAISPLAGRPTRRTWKS